MTQKDKTNRLVEAIEEIQRGYDLGKLVPLVKDNPICQLTDILGNVNCLRCPLNVTAIEVGDFGCLHRNKRDALAIDEIHDAKIFNTKILDLIHKGINPYSTKVFHGQTKSEWAYSIRALNLVL